MPKYNVKPESNTPGAIASPSKKEKTYPSVCIPVSPEIIAALEVGGDVEVVLRGKVAGLESRQSNNTNDSWMNRNELRVELRVVEADPADAAEEEEEEPEKSMKDAIDEGLGYSKKKA